MRSTGDPEPGGEPCDERGALLPVDVCARTALFAGERMSVRARDGECGHASERVCNSVVDQRRALRIMQPTVLITL